jgi:opacity protein-like surface antigen
MAKTGFMAASAVSNGPSGNRALSARCSPGLRGLWFGKTGRRWLAGSLILAVRLAPAQEALRYSLAGNALAPPRQRQAESQPYTLKTGDFRLLVTPSLGLEWNDRVNLSQQNPESDFILKPMVVFNASHPIAQRNLLQLNVGVGYDQYFEHDNYSGLRLQSGSALSFDIGVKDFLINLHDRFQYTQDSAGQSAVAGSGQYGGLDNGAGLSITWDLRDVTLSVGYDHQNFISSSSEFKSANRASELLVARAGFRFHPRLTAGVEGTGSSTANEQPVLNNSVSYSAGVYADWRPGTYFQVQPRFGYTIFNFEQTSRFIQAKNQDAWYAGVAVVHELTDVMSYSVSAGHELRLGIQADAVEAWYLRPNFNWKIIKDVNLTTFLTYEHGTQGTAHQVGGLSETYDWFGGGLGISFALTKKLNLGLNYRLTIRSSDAASREYTQNLVGLQLTYLLQ